MAPQAPPPGVLMTILSPALILTVCFAPRLIVLGPGVPRSFLIHRLRPVWASPPPMRPNGRWTRRSERIEHWIGPEER
jgi:hypothetical protein